MPHNRYYADADLNVGESVRLSEEESHHLLRVSRARITDHLEVINGRGRLVQACLLHADKGVATLEICQLIDQVEAPPPIRLALALSRGSHLEWSIEKGTELGVSAFWLFPGAQSEKTTLSSSQQRRLEALCIAATKQCGRLHLPQICTLPPLQKWQQAPESELWLLCEPDPSAPYLWELSSSFRQKPVTAFIGPEKGFNEEEIALMKQKGALIVRLHPYTLRAETAPLAAATLLSTAFLNTGRFSHEN